MTKLEERFQQTGERFLKRRLIESGLKEGQSLGGIREVFEGKKQRQQELLQEFTKEIIHPDPRYLKLTEYFYQQLKDLYPEIVACGLTGSGAIGGSLIREQTGTTEEADYDGFLIVKPKTEMKKISEIQATASYLLLEMVNNQDPLVEGLGADFHFCPAINYRSLNFEDLRDGLTIDLDAVFDGARTLLQVFFPTYPPEVGEGNRQKLLDHLQTLPMEEWRIETEWLKDQWEEMIEVIKSKHLLSNETLSWYRGITIFKDKAKPLPRRTVESLYRDVTQGEAVSKLSNKINRQLFFELIDSTKPRERAGSFFKRLLER